MSKLSISTKYQIKETLPAIGIFYAIVIGSTILLAIISGSISPDEPASLTGMELASCIFLFVAGLNSFKENFKMLMQNSVSRRSIMLGRLITTGIVSLFFAVVDCALFLLSDLYFASFENVVHANLFGDLYSRSLADLPFIVVILLTIVFSFFVNMALSCAGYFITLLFYRMNKLGKTLIGAGVPVVFLYLIPILDHIFNNGRLSIAFAKFIDFAYGISAGAYGRAFLSFFIMSALFSTFSWLLMRKAAVKK